MVPSNPKIYHIVHLDRLPSIIEDDCLWCDAEIVKRSPPGTAIGLTAIKQRRLYELTLASYPDLHIGECVPFYFCPRSVMLYLIYQGNHPEIDYRGGQGLIIHLEADLHAAIEWAKQKGRRWAFTLSNAGSYYFEDRCQVSQLEEINWDAIHADQWSGPGVSSGLKDGKQAEFLMEYNFPWRLVERIGVLSNHVHRKASQIVSSADHRPLIQARSDWYY